MIQILSSKRRTRERLIAYWIWLSVLIISLLLLCAWLFDGFAANEYEFIEFYTCPGYGNTEPNAEYFGVVERIYLCGEIEANGIVTGSIHIYRNSVLVTRDRLSQREGQFIHEIRYLKGFQPGEYTINFYAGKRVQAQTAFIVKTDIFP